eukprot:6173951-Pleurochrysis_carterae.AAC.1
MLAHTRSHAHARTRTLAHARSHTHAFARTHAHACVSTDARASLRRRRAVRSRDCRAQGLFHLPDARQRSLDDGAAFAAARALPRLRSQSPAAHTPRTPHTGRAGWFCTACGAAARSRAFAVCACERVGCGR